MTSSSPVASRNFANPTQSPENNSVPKTPGTSGRTCLEQFGNHARAGLWAKTLAGLLIGQTGWFSSRCALIWKLKGTKYNRLYFRLAVSTPRTDVIGFGLLPTAQTQGLKVCDSEGKTQFMNLSLLPTPIVKPGNRETTDGKNVSHTTGKRYGLSIAQAAKLLPTPKAREAPDCESERKRHTPSMESMLVMGFLPTTAAQDGKNGTLPPSQTERNSVPGWILSNLETGQTSQLNPRFVESMMGFPNQWLEI